MKLSDLLKKITPLPYKTKLGKVIAENYGLVAACSPNRGSKKPDNRELANVIYLYHCANVLPELVEVLKPFSHPDLSEILGGNVEGDKSIVFARNKAVLTIGDFKRVIAALAHAEDIKDL